MNKISCRKVLIFFILFTIMFTACQPAAQTEQIALTETPIAIDETETSKPPTNPSFEAFTPENVINLETVSLLGIGQVHDVATSADQSKIAVYVNNEIKIYDAGSLGEIITILAGTYNSKNDRHQNIIEFSPDGKTLAFTNGQFVLIWDLKANKRINGFSSLIPEWGVTNIEFSPNGERLLVTTSGGSWRCDGRDTNYSLYDLSGNLLFSQYACADYTINKYKFISDDKIYFSFSSIFIDKVPQRFYLVSLRDGNLLETSKFDYAVEASNFQEKLYDVSPSGRLFAYVVYESDKTYTKLIDSTTRTHIETIEGLIEFFDDNGVDNWRKKSVDFQPTEEKLISEKCVVKNLSIFEKIREIAVNNNKIVLEVSRSNKFAYLELLDLNSCQVIKRIEYSSANKAVYSPDTRWLATTDGFNVYVWNLRNMTLQFSSIGIPFRFPKNIIQFNGDGTQLIVGTQGYEHVYPEQPYRNYKIFIFDVETGSLIREIKPRTQFLNSLFATNDKDIIMASDSDGFHFWNTENGDYISTLPSGAFTFNPDVSQIWIAPQKRGDPDLNKIFLFDYKTGDIVKDFSNAHWVRGLYLSDDNKKLMAHLFLGQSAGDAISIFDIETGETILSYTLPWDHQQISVYGNSFMTTGSNGYIHFWDFDNDVPYLTFSGYRKNHKVKDNYDANTYEYSHGFSAELINDEIFLIKSDDLYLWNIANANLISRLSPDYAIVDLVVSPDQSLICAIGKDGIIRLWAVVK